MSMSYRARLVMAMLLGWFTFELPAATPQCGSPHMTYFGGRVLANVEIVPVFYGTAVNAQLTSASTGIAQFYADVTQSAYWTLLSEYDTPYQHIGPGSAYFGITIQPAVISYSSTFVVTDVQIQQELQRQVFMGVLPAPDANTLYMISFPANASVTGPASVGNSCTSGGFCAYHNSFMAGSTPNVYCYAVLMDTFTGGCASGCARNGSGLKNATDCASHELVESVTDPDVGLVSGSAYAYPAAWADNNNGCDEIADICNDGGAGDTINVGGRSWVVQEFWSDCLNACASTGPVAVANSQTVVTPQNTALPVTLAMANPGDFCHYQDYAVTVNPAHGSLSGATPNLTYTPAAGYHGTDSFQFTVNGSSPAVVTITVVPFLITSSALDATKTNFVVCWQSVPGVVYNVLTNASLTTPGTWVSAGSTNATGTTTCYTLPGRRAGKATMFVVIQK